ncbi:MAG: hypothetical protein WBW84_19205 [Acidobacteriaceae bacterium]
MGEVAARIVTRIFSPALLRQYFLVASKPSRSHLVAARITTLREASQERNVRQAPNGRQLAI